MPYLICVLYCTHVLQTAPPFFYILYSLISFLVFWTNLVSFHICNWRWLLLLFTIHLLFFFFFIREIYSTHTKCSALLCLLRISTNFMCVLSLFCVVRCYVFFLLFFRFSFSFSFRLYFSVVVVEILCRLSIHKYFKYFFLALATP